MIDVYAELEWRNLVHQTTSDELKRLLAGPPISLYIGFDPSASSLHVGSLIPLMTFVHFLRGGHRVIVLIGGATGMIGDPSGKSEERVLQSIETTDRNGQALARQIGQFLEGHGGPADGVTFVNNKDWLGKVGLLEFLRDIGKHFSVNQMLQRDSVRRRLEAADTGISYTEFSYMLLQSYDFYELFRRQGCVLQCGASDQWGNIVSGMDLVQRKTGATVHGLTMPLFTNSEGKKYGKSEQGTVWLDPQQTSPYRFFQFWINMPDADVGRCLRWFTLLDHAVIEELERHVGSSERAAQKTLAYEVTTRVHGKDEADRAVRASAALFGGEIRDLPTETILEVFSDVPSVTISAADLAGTVPLSDLMIKVGASKSRSEARRLVSQGGIRLNGSPLTTDSGPDPSLGTADFRDGHILVIRVGKRNNYLVRTDTLPS